MTKKPYVAPGLLRWWPLAVVALISAAAWGQQKATTDGIVEKSVAHLKRIEQNEKTVRVLEKGQATILERTLQMQLINRENRDTLKEVLKELRRR